MDREEELRELLLNPQRCQVCEGQDGVLERDESESAFVHPYCKPFLEVAHSET